MQSAKVVQLIKWIRDSLSPSVIENVLSGRLLHSAGKDSTTEMDAVLASTHDWARDAQRISANPEAVQVIEAFGGREFLKDGAPTDFAKAVLTSTNRPSIRGSHYGLIVHPFRVLFESVDPWEKLTVPKELRTGELPDDLLSITIESKEATSARTLQEVLTHLMNLYDVYSRFSEEKPIELEIVSIQSGSPINFSLKGSGELLKQLRLLINDAWTMFRFKSQQEQIATNNVLLSNLSVMAEIDKRKRDSTIAPEEAEKMKRAISKNTLGLLNLHALPTDRTGIETINNTLLLEQFNPRLLGVGESAQKAEDQTPLRPRLKKTVQRKRSSSGKPAKS